MSSAVQSLVFKLGLTFLVVLGLGLQPNWQPLLDDVRIAGASGKLTDESRQAIEDAYTRQPWNSDWAMRAGLAAGAFGDYETAQAALRAAAANGGWTPELHIALGDALAGSGDVDAAIAEWEAALPDRLTDPFLLDKLARAYEAKGRYPEAAATLRSLVALEPQNAAAQYRFGLILAVIDPPSAPSHLALAAGMDPTVQPLVDSLNNAVEAGQQTNDESLTFAFIGQTLILLGEFPLAKAALLNALNERPDYAEAYALLGSAEEELGNDGEYAYQKALALNNDLALAHHLYGKYQWRKGQIDQAIASFKTAFELDPSNPAVPADLGGLYAAQADLPEAEFWYRQAVQVAPDKSLPWLWLARFYVEYDLKVDGDGLLSAQKAVELDPESAP
ncbi:MAG TPA: tetratricopeptide repeat protein, partial [Anaerolineales bacterium]|nr:tetratricopeptide repeat protein [Anaerolineales bacterium]